MLSDDLAEGVRITHIEMGRERERSLRLKAFEKSRIHHRTVCVFAMPAASGAKGFAKSYSSENYLISTEDLLCAIN